MSASLTKKTRNEVFVPTSPSFDIALFTVSSLLSEARFAEETGDESRAERYFALAERRALHSGFLELVNLVWIDRKPVESRLLTTR